MNIINKRKRIFLLLALCTFTCYGCSAVDNDNMGKREAAVELPVVDEDSRQQIDSNKEEITDISGQIKMKVKVSENIDVTIKNNSSTEIIVGEEYKLQKANGKIWEDIPLSVTWNDLGIIIPAGGSYTFHYDLNMVPDFENDKSYRIIKTVHAGEEQYEAADIFEIKEETESAQEKIEKTDAGENSKPETNAADNGEKSMNNIPSVDTDSARQVISQKENSVDISSQLIISVEVVGGNGINVTIFNNSTEQIMVGEEYKLQKANGEAWEDIPLSIAWNDLGIEISAGNSYTFRYDLSAVLLGEEQASYRIIKSVYANQTKYDISSIFTLN